MNSRRQAGQSVLELMVSIALVSIAFLIALDLWDYAVGQFGAANRAVHNPPLAPISHLLHDDLAAAAAHDDPGFRWASNALAIDTVRGTTVTYRLLRDGSLVRSERNGSGPMSSQRRVLSRVGSWRWRWLTPDLIEVRITLLMEQGPVGASRQPGSEEHERTEVYRIARRSDRGGGSW